MKPRPGNGLRKPRNDDRPLWDVFFGVWGYPAVFVAHELQLFELLSNKPLTVDEVAEAKGIQRRPADALLALCASIGLLQLRGNRYSLTTLAKEYMLPSSPTYFGWMFDAWRLIYSVWSPDSLRDAVLSDKPQGVFSDPGGAFASWHAEHAGHFTRDAQREYRSRDGMAQQAGSFPQSRDARCWWRFWRSLNRGLDRSAQAQSGGARPAGDLRGGACICRKVQRC